MLVKHLSQLCFLNSSILLKYLLLFIPSALVFVKNYFCWHSEEKKNSINQMNGVP